MFQHLANGYEGKPAGYITAAMFDESLPSLSQLCGPKNRTVDQQEEEHKAYCCFFLLQAFYCSLHPFAD